MSARWAISAGPISTIRAACIEEKLGDKVETAYLESVPEGADAERAIERFARSGCNIIFTTSFGYMDPTNKVAKDFPDVKFEHATGYKPTIRTWRPTIPSSSRAAM
jgi:basic membrane lipoprotein Med (substrate-binding protein (PBP1-ABC) superfamily)